MTSKLLLTLVTICGAAVAVFLVFTGGCMATGCNNASPFVLPQSIDTFEECVAAGFPVTGLNTQRCRLESGRIFTKVGVGSSASSEGALTVESSSSEASTEAASVASSSVSVSSTAASSKSSQATSVATATRITVTAPANGATIGRKLIVQGSAVVIPKGNLLYRLRDENGNVLVEGVAPLSVAAIGQEATFMINVGYLAPGTKTGYIELFTGSAADPKNVLKIAVTFPSL